MTKPDSQSLNPSTAAMIDAARPGYHRGLVVSAARHRAAADASTVAHDAAGLGLLLLDGCTREVAAEAWAELAGKVCDVHDRLVSAGALGAGDARLSLGVHTAESSDRRAATATARVDSVAQTATARQ